MGSHSLEGSHVAEVQFLGGAGTLASPFPCTQLTQVGELLHVRTGDAAAGEELGCCCSTRRHGPQGMSWLGPPGHAYAGESGPR